MTSYSYNPTAPLRALTQSLLFTAIIAMLLLVSATDDKDSPFRNIRYKYFAYPIIHMNHDTDDSQDDWQWLAARHINDQWDDWGVWRRDISSGNKRYIYSACYMHHDLDDSHDGLEAFWLGLVPFGIMNHKYRVCYMHHDTNDSRYVRDDFGPSWAFHFTYYYDTREDLKVRRMSAGILRCRDGLVEREFYNSLSVKAKVSESRGCLGTCPKTSTSTAQIYPNSTTLDTTWDDQKSFSVPALKEFAEILDVCFAVVMAFSAWIITIMLIEMLSHTRYLWKPSYLSMRAEVKEMVIVEFAVMSVCTSAADIGQAECQLKSSSLGSCCVETHCTAESDSEQGDIICYQKTIDLVPQQTKNKTGLFLEVVFLMMNGSQINCCSVIQPSVPDVSECVDFVDENPSAPVITSTQPISASPKSSASAHYRTTKSSSIVTTYQNLPPSATILSDQDSSGVIPYYVPTIIIVLGTLFMTSLCVIFFLVIKMKKWKKNDENTECNGVSQCDDGVNYEENMSLKSIIMAEA